MYLNCKTWFSLRYGTYKTEELVQAAADRKVSALALTNINSTADIWDFVDYCDKAGIKPIAGTEIRNADKLCYILIAQNNEGFTSINRFLSRYLEADKPFPDRPADLRAVYVIYPLHTIDAQDLGPDEFIGVQPIEINKLFRMPLNEFPGKFVITHPVSFQDKTRHNLHRLMRAIAHNTLISKQDSTEYAPASETFLSAGEIMQAFADHPDLIISTLKLVASCSITMDFGSDKTKQLFTTSKEDDRRLLEKLAYDGLKKRYGSKNRIAAERIKQELKVIHELGFTAYYLVTWDMVRYARSRGFFLVGRGSGANSIVAYALGITDVDPIELDLYFERFLNPYRASPPDFDIDFSHTDRDEIIDYLFRRFGSDHVTLLAAYTTFQERAIIRELGKVYGLPPAEISQLEAPGADLTENRVYKQILTYGRLLRDYPDNLSIHAGGILISEQPIYAYSATELPPKGFRTSQFDMFVAEKIGLFKLDVLSQRGLGHIKDAVSLILSNKGITIDIEDIDSFKKDPKIAQQIREADTIGCFYIESPAMRQLLKKLKCDDYLTLVAASSIIRPGVAQSGMMRTYIYRYHHPDGFEYLHPKMEELLKETFGVMVFQEDVIKVVHHIGRLDKGKADIVRKGMSGKYRGGVRFEDLQAEFILNCVEDGMQESLAREIWRQVESFRGYSFSKAHSASYAVESYQSLALKTYHPAEFMVGVINNFGGFYRTELYIHELKRTGVKVLPPCINESIYMTSIRGTVVHLGFVHIIGIQKEIIETILLARKLHGPYLHLQDFLERTHCPLEQLNLLIRVGAFRFTQCNKKALLWEANFLQKKFARRNVHATLFEEQQVSFVLPQLEQTFLEDAYDEIELLGFPLCNVWDLVDADITKYCTAADLPKHLGKVVETVGYFITDKHVHTKNDTSMFFGTFLDKEGNWLDTVHFPGSFKWTPFSGGGYYVLKGKVVEEFGVYSIEVNHCYKLGRKKIEE